MVGCAERHLAPTRVKYDLAVALIIRKHPLTAFAASILQHGNSDQLRVSRTSAGVPRTLNETMVRMALDHILYGTLEAVKAKRPVTARDLFIQTETSFSSTPVTHNLRKRCIHGFADYTLWYGSRQRMETNLVVWEAKREGSSQIEEPQPLAYGYHSPSPLEIRQARSYCLWDLLRRHFFPFL